MRGKSNYLPVNVINKINLLNQKYNIIKTDRIKDVSLFCDNIGFIKYPNASFLVVYFEGEMKNKEKFTFTEFEGYHWYTPKEKIDDIPCFADEKNVLGTVGFKPYHDTTVGKQFEVTVFTSLKRGLSNIFFNY